MLTASIRRIALIAMLVSASLNDVASAQTSAPRSFKHEGIHAVLLAASMSNVPWEAKLPPTVAKALKDASQFLPFTYYELMDQAMLRGAGVQQIRLRGMNAREYTLNLTTRPTNESADRITVQVSMSETWGAVRSDVMMTEYSARIGETVVVGTSKVKSGTSEPSIVLLVTLLPRP